MTYSYQDWNDTFIGGSKKAAKRQTTHHSNPSVKYDEDGEIVIKQTKIPFSLSKNIQKARTLKGWSQVDLANKVGVQSKVISEWESGKVNVENTFVQKLEKAFNLYLKGEKALTPIKVHA